MLGGNRAVSYDSRQWGFLAAGDLYGGVVPTCWPPTDMRIVGL